jgi:hypothetical protein
MFLGFFDVYRKSDAEFLEEQLSAEFDEDTVAEESNCIGPDSQDECCPIVRTTLDLLPWETMIVWDRARAAWELQDKPLRNDVHLAHEIELAFTDLDEFDFDADELLSNSVMSPVQFKFIYSDQWKSSGRKRQRTKRIYLDPNSVGIPLRDTFSDVSWGKPGYVRHHPISEGASTSARSYEQLTTSLLYDDSILSSREGKNDQMCTIDLNDRSMFLSFEESDGNLHQQLEPNQNVFDISLDGEGMYLMEEGSGVVGKAEVQHASFSVALDDVRLHLLALLTVVGLLQVFAFSQLFAALSSS